MNPNYVKEPVEAEHLSIASKMAETISGFDTIQQVEMLNRTKEVVYKILSEQAEDLKSREENIRIAMSKI